MKWLAGLLMMACVQWLHAEPGLRIDFGAGGLEKITFAGQVLEDTTRWPGDALHVWHMKSFDAATGRPRQDGEYGWGENNQGRTWDSASHTATYRFVWGSLRVQYAQQGDALEMRVEEFNRNGSGVILDGASVYPATLHLPGGAQVGGIVDGREAPAVSAAAWPSVAAVVSSADAVYAGFQPSGDNGYAVMVSSTGPDALPESSALPGRPLRPGQTDSFTVTLRLSDSPMAGEAAFLHGWSEAHPMKLNWPDRRILGTVYLASSGQGDKTRPAGFATNPRRYFNDATVDIKSPAGLRTFQARVLAEAAAVVGNLRRMDAQGAITWDVEGEEYPQSTSYVCAPEEIARVAPEMESVVAPGLPHAGERLDDAYFRTIREAGFRVGVCVRPQRFTLGDGRASQEFLSVGEVAAELIRKMRWAHDRWGATIFYLDSTVRELGWPLPSGVIEQAASALPDSLLIPEESTPRMYGSTAPFRSFLFHGETGVPVGIRLFYPHAFAANLINDVDATKLAAHRGELVDAVRLGDILMVHADSWNPNNATVMGIYREAGRR